MGAVNGSALQTLMGMIKAPVTPQSMRFAQAWQQAEGGNAAFNPFNTTQGAPGAGNYNSVGVKNYGNLQQGLQATAQTLLNGHYGKLVSDLRGGKASAMQLAQDVAASPWGTGSLIEKVLGGKVSAPAAGSGGASPIAAPGGDSSGSAPMRQALLQLVLANTQALASGQTPGSGNAVAILQALSSGAFGSGGASGGASGGSGSSAGQSLLTGGGSQAPGAAGKVLSTAKTMLGTPYVWGGNTPGKALDCSAFIQQTFKAAGVNLPRTTQEQIKVGKAVSLDNLRAGDAVFTEPGKTGPGHVGLYIGNGQVQESPHTGDHNKIIPLKDFLGGGFVGARRYV